MLNSRSITRIQSKGGTQTTFNGETANSSRVGQKPRPRIESLTDLVFGPALSIGAIGLISNRPKNTQILVESIARFGFSFMILIAIWVRYSEVTPVLRVEMTRIRVPNTTLLTSLTQSK
jgi:hypothetical protein